MPPQHGVGVPASAAERSADLERLREGAALLTQSGNRVAALAVLWAAVAIDPADFVVHRRLAATLASAGDIDGAASEYARYVELLLPEGDVERATAELHYAARTLGHRPAIAATVRDIAAALPAYVALERTRPAIAEISALASDTVVRLPVTHRTIVTFYTCLHDDGEAAWLQLEGGSDDALPEKVRLRRGEEVLEVRRCVPMPAGRKSHARPTGDSKVWVVLRAPEAMLRAIDRDEADDYVVEALVDGTWSDIELIDTGCRFGRRRTGSESRSA